jgi:hypothetical protein
VGTGVVCVWHVTEARQALLLGCLSTRTWTRHVQLPRSRTWGFPLVIERSVSYLQYLGFVRRPRDTCVLGRNNHRNIDEHGQVTRLLVFAECPRAPDRPSSVTSGLGRARAITPARSDWWCQNAWFHAPPHVVNKAGSVSRAAARVGGAKPTGRTRKKEKWRACPVLAAGPCQSLSCEQPRTQFPLGNAAVCGTDRCKKLGLFSTAFLTISLKFICAPRFAGFLTRSFFHKLISHLSLIKKKRKRSFSGRDRGLAFSKTVWNFDSVVGHRLQDSVTVFFFFDKY